MAATLQVTMTRRQRMRRALVAAAATAVLPLGVLVASPPAQAATTTTYMGKVTAAVLNVRFAPTSASAKVGSLSRGVTVKIQCKVFGPRVDGNDLWYKLATGRWVSARYVSNVGVAPRFCGDGNEYYGRVISSGSLSVRSGPHTANAKVSSAPRGSRLDIVCKVDSQSIDGNRRW